MKNHRVPHSYLWHYFQGQTFGWLHVVLSCKYADRHYSLNLEDLHVPCQWINERFKLLATNMRCNKCCYFAAFIVKSWVLLNLPLRSPTLLETDSLLWYSPRPEIIMKFWAKWLIYITLVISWNVSKCWKYFALFRSSPVRKANIFISLGNSQKVNLMTVLLTLTEPFSICSISLAIIAMYLLAAVLCSEQLLMKIKKMSSLLRNLWPTFRKLMSQVQGWSNFPKGAISTNGYLESV